MRVRIRTLGETRGDGAGVGAAGFGRAEAGALERRIEADDRGAVAREERVAEAVCEEAAGGGAVDGRLKRGVEGLEQIEALARRLDRPRARRGRQQMTEDVHRLLATDVG